MRFPISSNLRSDLTGGIYLMLRIPPSFLRPFDPSHSSILQASAFIHAPIEMPRPHLSSETGCVSLCSVRGYCSRRSVEEDIPSETCPSFPAHINIPPPLMPRHLHLPSLPLLLSSHHISLIQRHPFDMIPNHPYSKPCFKM